MQVTAQPATAVQSAVDTGVKIRLDGVVKRREYDGVPLTVLDGVEFFARDGEFVSIVGPSGCGKSTLLNIIAGLDEPDRGAIHLDGISAERRLGQVGYMQQKDLLFPWRNVVDNALIGLELRGVPRRDSRERALELMDSFGLSGFESAYPHALSGGMRQRVSFLRTVLADQQIFLLDEPLSALDALNRAQMQEWMQHTWLSLRKTVVLVTHDVDEAVFLSDRVYVMSARPGRMKLVLDVDLPRPRSLDVLTDPEFVAMKARLLRAIRGENGREAR